MDEQRFNELKSMSYEDYLQTPEWLEKRDLALVRDGYRCRVCDKNEDLNVHHRSYKNGRGNEDLNDLTTLCKGCHSWFHSRNDQVQIKQSLDTEFARFYGASFESFVTEIPGVLSGYYFAKHYAEEPIGWLVLTGPYGCGKTHLLISIVKKCLETGYTAAIYSVPELLLEKSAEIFEKIKDVDILALDDYGSEPVTAWAKTRMFQLLNYRFNKNLSTVIASNNIYLEGIDPRVYSRLRDQNLVHVVEMEGVRDFRINGADLEDEEL